MKPKGTLLLNRQEIASLLTLEDYIQVVEEAFRAHGLGKTLAPGLLHIDSGAGEFHIKAGGLTLDKTYFGLKANGSFFQNRARNGMPNIQGTISVCDGENGYPLALMDSIEITIRRTGAATAVASKYLARANSSVATVCGCGNQGRSQLRALCAVLPIRHAYAYDRDASAAVSFAEEMSTELEIQVTPVEALHPIAGYSDVVVTCTPAKEFYLRLEDIRQGTFISAVGADSPDKQELDPRLISAHKVVADILDQCIHVGEIHHAVTAGLISREHVHAELGDVLAGRKPGRISDGEVIIFDSTGTALQDVAAAVAVYRRAVSLNLGRYFEFAG
jgi:ornithine cyclodeaminase/alanine dehydrogenase